jgi:hypothetical protein
MKKTGIHIPQKDKEKFLKGRRKTAKLAFDGFVIYKKKLIKAIRKKFGYSSNTVDIDIMSSFRKVWEQIN